jgi:hypothetical protein
MHQKFALQMRQYDLLKKPNSSRVSAVTNPSLAGAQARKKIEKQ